MRGNSVVDVPQSGEEEFHGIAQLEKAKANRELTVLTNNSD